MSDDTLERQNEALRQLVDAQKAYIKALQDLLAERSEQIRTWDAVFLAFRTRIDTPSRN